jgi:hypothetical protein
LSLVLSEVDEHCSSGHNAGSEHPTRVLRFVD